VLEDLDILDEEPAGCSICLCEHDEEIHAATQRLHGWMRQEVTKWLFDFSEVELDDDPVEFFLIEPSAA
jgi:hypothetical protein